MLLPTKEKDPGLYPYRQGLIFAFFNAVNWQIATATPTVLFMAYLGADSFQTGMVYSWPLLLTPVQVLATMLLPKLGFKRLTLMGWGARSWFLLVPLTLALLARDGAAPWMIYAMIAAMFFYSVSRSMGAAAISTWLHGLIPETVRGRYWATDQILSGIASVGTLVLSAAAFVWLPMSWSFLLLYALSITGAWLALRSLRTLPDIERPTVMGFDKLRADTPRYLFAPGNFRTYLWLSVGYFVVYTPLVPFSAYYLKTAEGFSSASVMGYTVVQYLGVIAGNWFMRSRIDLVGTKPFFRLAFGTAAAVAAGWLICLGWVRLLLGLMPVLYFLLGVGNGVFVAANVSYLAKILPRVERALPVSLQGALSFCLGGFAALAWGLVLKGGGAVTSVNLIAFRWFFVVTLVGAIVLLVRVNRLEERAGQVDPLLEGDWLFRPFRIVSGLVRLAERNDKDPR